MRHSRLESLCPLVRPSTPVSRTLMTYLPELMADGEAGRRPQIANLCRAALDILDEKRRPTARTSHFAAWQHSRTLASLTGAFPGVYTDQTMAQEPLR
jgi:hypothetical protein